MTLISIEGNIGSGKEYVMNFFKRYFTDDIIFIEDNVYNWKDKILLKDFYKKPQRWAFTLQIKSITQKYKRFLNVLPHKKKGSVIITNRSPMSDCYCFKKSCFNMNYLTEKEDSIYDSVFESYRIPRFHGVIYLRSNVNKCYESIITHDDKIEKHISFDFLLNIHKNYESWIARVKEDKIPILEINAEDFRDIDASEMIQQKLFYKIIEKFPQLIPFVRNKNALRHSI